MMKPFGAAIWGLVLLSTVGIAGQANAQLAGALTIEVDGLNSQDGNVCFKVFSGSTGFPNSNENAIQRTCVAIAPSPSESSAESSAEPSADAAVAPFTYTFENLPFNTYAVAIYHDRNGDEQLNRNGFGMPTEGYGFSNDAPVNLGPPRYGDAAFLLAGTNTTIQIKMRYSQ
jgi:uncharacterized protein (DUF2141 family)